MSSDAAATLFAYATNAPLQMLPVRFDVNNALHNKAVRRQFVVARVSARSTMHHSILFAYKSHGDKFRFIRAELCHPPEDEVPQGREKFIRALVRDARVFLPAKEVRKRAVLFARANLCVLGARTSWRGDNDDRRGDRHCRCNRNGLGHISVRILSIVVLFCLESTKQDPKSQLHPLRQRRGQDVQRIGRLATD